MTKNQTHLHLQEWAPIVYQPNQAEPMEFFQTRIVNEWNHLGSCMPTKCILFTINIGPSDHVFHDVQPAFDWSHQHPPINDGKSGFGGKGHALTGTNTSRVDLPTKHTMVVFSGFAWSNGSKMRQRSWNALTLSLAVGWEWIGASG